MCGRKSSRLLRFTAAYAVPASKCDASMMLTMLHSVTAGGVTFFQVFPPSFVIWIFPSSVPTQITPSFTGDGARVRIVPRRFLVSFSSARMRVKSGLISSQFVPALLVFIRNCVPRYRRCESCGEKTRGIVQLKRYLLPCEIGAGEMSRTCPEVLESRTTLPPGPAL